ncbi:LysR substrate-binding domain-containing protein [Castellaniella sp.]|uniref:LysR substrate-binding domain-containing protein n=1 Tax=Castellaniella sp. TaxID=1955812 RepID=UPI0035622E37
MDKENVNSRQLRVFCLTARYGNFSQAARMMGVSPAYISKNIKALEAELDVMLFHRSTRHVALTEQGEEIYALSRQILQDIEQLHDTVAEYKQEPRGRLKVSTSFGFGRQVVAPALAEFTRRYPDIQIQIEVLDQLVNLALEHYDLDIRIGDLIDPNYIARHLAYNHRVLCASPDYLERRGEPRELQELTRHDCLIVRERDHPVGIWALNCGSTVSNVKVNGPLITNNGEVALSWAVAGHGIVLRSVWDAGKYLESGRLRVILPDYRQIANIWAVYPQRLEHSAKIKVCVEFLAHHFATMVSLPTARP